MKPSQLSLFPTDQADTWRYSDEDACYDCNYRVYDMDKKRRGLQRGRADSETLVGTVRAPRPLVPGFRRVKKTP